MSTPTAAHYRVALAGFSAFERDALTSFFRLAGRREPTYVQVATAEQSDFLIADADQRDAVDAVLAVGRTADTVFVGSRAPADAMAWLTRPIDPIHIVRELDLLVALRGAGADAGVEAPRQSDVDLLLHDLQGPRNRPAPAPPARAPFGAGGRDVLVVEDSAIARKFLALRLQRLGYRVHLADHGEEAIEMVARQSFAVAFVDVVLGSPGSMDGLRVCQHIKHRAPQAGVAATAVVLVTGLAGPTDRVRGSLAGCDAYLVKPLLEASFIAALRAVDPVFGQQSPAR